MDNLFALHISSGGDAGKNRCGQRFAECDTSQRQDEQEDHGDIDGPALLAVFYRLSECDTKCSGYQQNRQQLQKIRQGCRVFQRKAEFAPKNPPPLVPSCLMAIWLAAGPNGMV